LQVLCGDPFCGVVSGVRADFLLGDVVRLEADCFRSSLVSKWVGDLRRCSFVADSFDFNISFGFVGDLASISLSLSLAVDSSRAAVDL
jgi:hypothetical protein